MYVQDVVVHTNVNVFPYPNPQFDPPLPDPFQVADGIWIGKIDHASARIIFDINESSFHGMPKPVTQFAQLYSFVSEIPGPRNPFEWDADGRLQNCIAVSRLLVPTSVALRYAARIRYNTDKSVADIFSHQIFAALASTLAYLSENPQRD